MENNGLSSWNKLELRAYRLMGINQFRKAILWFERVKHHKDNRKNENYHPFGFGVCALEQYTGFLLYNASLHGISMFFSVIYFIFAFTLKNHNVVVDTIIAFLSIFNVYCILLQRANYLRIREYCHRYYKRFYDKAHSFSEEVLRRFYNKELQYLQSDYEVICRIKNAFEGQTDCTLNVADVGSLKRICEFINPLSRKKSTQRTVGVEEISLMERCNTILGPYTTLQMRADWLQRKVGLSGRKMLDHTVIITEGAECERLFKQIVPVDNAYNMCFVCILLYEVYASAVNKAWANEI